MGPKEGEVSLVWCGYLLTECGVLSEVQEAHVIKQGGLVRMEKVKPSPYFLSTTIDQLSMGEREGPGDINQPRNFKFPLLGG